MKAVILAGGLGERIRERYPDTIKSLIKFRDKPFIYYQIDLLIKNGFKQIVVCSGYGHKELTEYLDTENFSAEIFVSDDGDKPLGTGGAIKKALNHLGPEFMVIYGDSYLDFDYKRSMDKFLFSSKLALMTIYRNNNRFDKSNIWYKNNKIFDYSKQNPNRKYKYIDYGVSFFRAGCFFATPIDAFDLSSLYEYLIYKDMLDSDIIKERFYEIGSLSGIDEFDRYIRRLYSCDNRKGEKK